MSSIIERLSSVALGMSALAIAIVVVRRELMPPARSNAPKVEFHDNWKTFRQVGVATVGDSAAPVQIFEFGDFQCPACAAFDPVMQRVAAKFGDNVARVFVHFPLPRHEYARSAAHAAECAGQQGLFPAMKSALYAKQDSFGLRPWTAFALDAGVRDLSQFEVCIAREKSFERIDSGFALAEQLGLRGTPTTIVNGWAINGILRDSVLVQAIDAALRGRPLRNLGR